MPKPLRVVHVLVAGEASRRTEGVGGSFPVGSGGARTRPGAAWGFFRRGVATGFGHGERGTYREPGPALARKIVGIFVAINFSHENLSILFQAVEALIRFLSWAPFDRRLLK
jgi:hypothetical protein